MQARRSYDLPCVTPGEIIRDRTVWSALDFPDDRSWVRELEPPMLEEIAGATALAMDRGVRVRDMTPEGFPLARTTELLREVYRDIECGPGFAMLSGFPVDDLSDDEIAIAYAGFCSHLGRITLQNREGEYLLEVTDKGKGYDHQARGYHSTAHLDFHNDGTNMVTLLCVETSEEGGLSKLVSGPAVYNAIVREHPEFLHVLHRGFHHHRRDQREPSDPTVTPYRTPVFGFFQGLFHIAYTRPSILFCEKEGVEITGEERAALDYMESVVERPELHATMALRKGDIQLVNNFLLLHSRTGYLDSPQRKRKLLRLWLDDTNSRRLGPGKMDWYMPEHSRFTQAGGLAALEA